MAYGEIRAPRLKREILRFNDELKRKNFPRRAANDCCFGSAGPSDAQHRPLAASTRPRAGAQSKKFATGRSGSRAERHPRATPKERFNYFALGEIE